jgi:hypothetical protein
MLKSGIVWVTLICSCSIPSFSQKTISEEDQQWLQYYNETRINDNLSFNFDGGIRFRNGVSDLRAALIRAGLGYRVYKPIWGISGIALFSFFENFGLNRLEIRPYQDFFANTELGKGMLRHRFRVEGRYFTNYNTAGQITGNEFYFRFRYGLNFLFPLVQLSKKNPDRKIFLNLADELFINAGTTIVYNMFDNNRVIAGFAFQENKNLRISLLYNFQFGQRNVPQAYNMTHVLWLTVNHRIVPKEKK